MMNNKIHRYASKFTRPIVLSFVTLFMMVNIVEAAPGYCNGIKLCGKVKVVERFADIKVKVVDHFPDLKVKRVQLFPNKIGEWQFVTHGEDFTIQYVTAFPDLKIQFVDHFPGVK